MPLKKPSEIPKLPKTRKKNAQAAIEAIPQKKPDKIEYICKSFFKYDKIKKKQLYCFAIETAVEFTSFAYEVTLDVLKERNEIFFIITGLKAKSNIMPDVQPARTEIEFEKLIGEYNVNVVKQDGAINTGSFKINIYNKEIILQKEFQPKKENNRVFCKFEVAEDEFTFQQK